MVSSCFSGNLIHSGSGKVPRSLLISSMDFPTKYSLTPAVQVDSGLLLTASTIGEVYWTKSNLAKTQTDNKAISTIV